MEGITHEGPPHLVVVSFLLGHCLHGQGSQAEVVLQKQGVDVLQWHVALRVGRGRLVLEDAEDLGVSGWGSGETGLWWGAVLMATCWWMDTFPASAIFMMFLANSSSGGRQQGSESGRV